MDSRQYQSHSLRTVPADLAYWTTTFEGDAEDARTRLLCNCALGLAGEATEIDENPSSDEIGDGYWYAFTLFHILGIDSYEPRRGEQQNAGRNAHRAAGGVCELAKKHMFHGRPLADIGAQLANYTRAYVDALASLDKQDAAATFDQNVDKLRARYPDGFFERG